MKKGIKFIFIVLLVVFSILPVSENYLAAPQEVSNLVIFVKYQGDGGDYFNAGNNWSNIKGMYQESGDSFKTYISTISEGKVNVSNYFPQEDGTQTGVVTYTLSKPASGYTGDAPMVQEILQAIREKKIDVTGISSKLDNLNAGFLDNMTILIQGSDYPGGYDSAHKSQYEGTDTITTKNGTYYVKDYNMIVSASLVALDGAAGVRQAQGVISHEFMHTLGFMDLYRSDGSGIPVGLWDPMATNSSFLQYPLSYIRAEKGWITATEITTSGTYTLNAVSETGAGNQVFILKTPVSDSELIVLEFRKKEDLSQVTFEQRIPATGILMYRVNPRVQYHTNFNGENYIYVYRPDVTSPEKAEDVKSYSSYSVNRVNVEDSVTEPMAAASLTTGESYGTTNLNDDFTKNTLYYSDGSNSGIKISDVVIASDEKSVTFKVEFADYTASTVWDKLGDSLDSNTSGNSPFLYTDSTTGDLYGAYIVNNQIIVKKWNGTAWQQVGTTISNAYMYATPVLATCRGDLYLAYQGSNGQNVICMKLQNAAWSTAATFTASYGKNLQFVPDEPNLYVAYEENIADKKNRLVIGDVLRAKIVTQGKTASDFASPSVTKSGKLFYVVHGDFFSAAPAVVESYHIEDMVWNTEYTSSVSASTRHLIKEENGKLYCLVGTSYGNPILTIYDGAQWLNTTVTNIQSFSEVYMEIIEDEVYLLFSSANGSNKTLLLRKNGNGFETLYDNIGSGLMNCFMAGYEKNLYIATKTENATSIYVKHKEMISPKYGLSFTLPSGYNDTKVYIDGEPYTMSVSGSVGSLTLPHSNGKTAMM